MDKDSTTLERRLMLFYVALVPLCIWQDATLLGVFSGFCLGACTAMYGVIKGWTRYYTPEPPVTSGVRALEDK
jgi:hypothetical protein